MKIYAIYYQREPRFSEDLIDPEKIGETHKYLGFMHARHLEELWRMMQGENWSPEGEARGLLDHLGIQYTSMSVGDVVFDCEAQTWHQCLMHGWQKIG